MVKEKFPTWLAEEISSAKMKKSETLELTGCLLEINKKENKVDAQFYEQLPDGRHIATLFLQNKKNLKDLELGKEYAFKVIVNKSALSDKAKDYLNKNYLISLDNLYGFELESLTLLK